MISTLKMSLKIDMTYAINSFIYMLRKLPIFKDLFTDDIYKSQLLKKCVRLLSILLSGGRMIVSRLCYFLVIYFISSFLCPDNISCAFLHIYFIFSILGMFLNNRILSTSTKKYFSIILFGMDAKEYMKSYLFWNIFTSFILNSIGFLVFYFVLDLPVLLCISLVLFSMFSRVVGEGMDVFYYKKHQYFWYDHTSIYFIVLGLFLGLAGSCYFGFFVPDFIIFIVTGFFFFFSIFSYRYLSGVDDYYLLYKKLNTKRLVMNQENKRAYSRQAMVEVRDKDKVIHSKKIQGKKGFDLFNTIFFERHKEIVLQSAKNWTGILFLVYVFLAIMVVMQPDVSKIYQEFLLYHMGWFVLIMYFVNRGSVVTQAMFFNCDHAMLSYNFYREPNVLLGLFKRRVVSIVKVNLLPAVVIGVGNVILLYLSGGADIFVYITTFLFIILLSIFFSVHHLVIYYLLQPYNKEMEAKKMSYSIVVLGTYLISYFVSGIVTSTLVFSILGSIITFLYIIISLFLVYRYAPRTFKLS